MAFNINDFKTALSQGGARANLFEVTIATPPVGSLSNFKFLCKTTTIPTSVIAPISIPFMGRDIKMAGDRTFDTWSTTIINDENFQIRNTLEQWLNYIKNHAEVKQTGTIKSYKKTATVKQLSKGGKTLKSYEFKNAWPTSLTEIPLDMGSGEIEEFSCVWNYDYWESTTTTGTTAGTGTTITSRDENALEGPESV